MTVSVPIPETIYDSVLYECSFGTLTLCEEKLSFETDQKVSVLRWKNVVRRQVTNTSSGSAKPMFKLILKSGTEAVFQMEDRISLEVLRDDLGERLSRWRKLNPEPTPTESAAVNKTRESFSSKRQSTPYSMVSHPQLIGVDVQSFVSSMSHSTSSSAPQQRRASCMGSNATRASAPQQRRASCMGSDATRASAPHNIRRSSSCLGPGVRKTETHPRRANPSTTQSTSAPQQRRASCMGSNATQASGPHNIRRSASCLGPGARKAETHPRRANPSTTQSTRSAPDRMPDTSAYTTTSRASTTGTRPFAGKKGRGNAPRPFTRTLSGETAKRDNRFRSSVR